MKARVMNSIVGVPYKDYSNMMEPIRYQISPSECKQDIMVYGKDIEFEIRMISKNGFYLPVDCDIDMEIKFTIIPKPQSPQIRTFK